MRCQDHPGTSFEPPRRRGRRENHFPIALLCVLCASAVNAAPTIRVTRDALCPGEISPLQYGQFVEYLCDLVPGLWAEKLSDGSFEGLSPYRVAYLKETDFRAKPWYPSGAGGQPERPRPWWESRSPRRCPANP